MIGNTNFKPQLRISFLLVDLNYKVYSIIIIFLSYKSLQNIFDFASWAAPAVDRDFI